MRQIKDYPGYFVTDTGVVYSINSGKGMRPIKQHTLVRDGYIGVQLWKEGKIKNKTLHVLLLETFVSTRPKGMQVCHNDGNKLNNRLDNLRWGTPKENAADRLKHNGKPCTKKLTKKEKAALKIALLNGESRASITQRFGVHRTTVNDYAKRLGLTKA